MAPDGARPDAARGTVAIVIPVCDHANLLAACLEAARAEGEPFDAELVVVDDGSSDGSAEAAERAGARVLRLDRRSGPYRARNVGWQATDAELVVFIDVRSRPRAAWLASLLAPFDDPQVAIAGGDSLVVAGGNLIERALAVWQPMQAANTLEGRYRPYFSTCNMATRRRTLEELGGFWETRSGGDADFCWRAQTQLGCAVVYAPGAVVDWEPRRSLADVLAQYYRYGYHSRALEQRFGAPGSLAIAPSRRVDLSVARAQRVARSLRRRGTVVIAARLLQHAALWAYRLGRWRAPAAPR